MIELQGKLATINEGLSRYWEVCYELQANYSVLGTAIA